MPFVDNEMAFAFNGELRGVRLREPGRIGAEKIFNLLKRTVGVPVDRASVQDCVDLIVRKTRYVRALNAILATPTRLFVSALHSENPEYFDIHYLESDEQLIVCSAPLDWGSGWTRIKNGTVKEFRR